MVFDSREGMGLKIDLNDFSAAIYDIDFALFLALKIPHVAYE